jgi:hypothetical protein
MNKQSIERINQLAHLFSRKSYGEVIYYNEAEEILKIYREERKFGIYVKRAKDLAIEQSKVLKAIPSVGWQVLKPYQVSGYVYRKYINTAANRYIYSDFILSNLETSNLSEERKEEYSDVRDLSLVLQRLTHKTIQESRYYQRKEYYESLKDE